MGSKGNDSRGSKPMRRRSQTRRMLQDSVINMAEARREIVQALQLHRSSTRTAAATSATVAASATTSSSAQCCYYSLTEAMPIPEPIWSTTAPTIPAAPSATAAAAVESLEFEWGESQAAAYNWWLGFLKTLDGKISNVENYSKYPHSRVFGCQDNLKLGEGKFAVGASDDQQNTAPDEWLTFPTSDDQQGDHTTTTTNP